MDPLILYPLIEMKACTRSTSIAWAINETDARNICPLPNQSSSNGTIINYIEMNRSFTIAQSKVII